MPSIQRDELCFLCGDLSAKKYIQPEGSITYLCDTCAPNVTFVDEDTANELTLELLRSAGKGIGIMHPSGKPPTPRR